MRLLYTIMRERGEDKQASYVILSYIYLDGCLVEFFRAAIIFIFLLAKKTQA